MLYEELSTRTQVAHQRTAARSILSSYPIEVTGLRLAAHGFNTTYRVDAADGRRFALRINVNSHRSAEQVRAEVSWVEALARDTDLRVPTPQRTHDGEIMVFHEHAALGRTVPAVLYSWLEGPNVEENLRPSRMRALGRAMATLHDHAEGWPMPSGASLNPFDRPLMDAPNHIEADHELLTPERRGVIDAAMEQVGTRVAALFTRHTPIVIHGDLHGANLKWHKGGLSLFDFDDTGFGVPAQDLAMAAYYFRDDLAAEATMREAYESVRTLDVTDAEYEAIVAGRNLVLINEVLVISTAEIRAMLPRYLANSVTKLRSYLDTGLYRHDIPGLIPAGE